MQYIALVFYFVGPPYCTNSTKTKKRHQDSLWTSVSLVQQVWFLCFILLGAVLAALVQPHCHHYRSISTNLVLFILHETTFWFTSVFLALWIYSPVNVTLPHMWCNPRHRHVGFSFNPLERQFSIINRKHLIGHMMSSVNVSTSFRPILNTYMYLYKWISGIFTQTNHFVSCSPLQ